MANTYSQLYIHFVFAVENRLSLISEEWEEELFKYISGILKGKNQKPIAVNGMPDHMHVLAGLRPTMSCSDIMQIVKGESSKWINSRGFIQGIFKWQSGFGAFSCSRGHLDHVYQYVMNQKNAHKTKSFRMEYLDLLEELEIPFDSRYIFHDSYSK
jgi:Transposase and inactivated derivatives